MNRRHTQGIGALAVILLLSGCNVGPKYARPPVNVPQSYKELPAGSGTTTENWKVAEPQDAGIHGNWWDVFNDAQLNTLEDQLNVSNQNIAQATANLMQARALVKEARSQLFPSVGVSASITRTRNPLIGGPNGSTNDYALPFDASWVPDLWGRVRNEVAANVAGAQISAADLENIRLTAQAELAVDYFSLRGEDALKKLLDSTVVAYQQSLDLTQSLYETGIDSDEAVAQAQTQLDATQAEDTNLGILRAQYEHAIATLIGQPASSFSLPALPLNAAPPPIPAGVPSQLLERRPDIAAAERAMVQANALIGVARAAYFPTLTLNASLGLESTDFAKWLTWPARFWSAGPSISETIFDAGLRKATVQQYRAVYDGSVASYRQTVLNAFQQVEDNLSSLRILSQEIQQQDAAVQAAQRNLGLATDRYRLGIDPYLNVITAQTSLLVNQQTAVNLRIQDMTAGVQLIEALGGGWDVAQLPSAHDLVSAPTLATSVSNTTAAPPSQPAQPAQSGTP